MTTFGALIDDVESYLSSYGMQRDKATTLVNGISSTDLTLAVTDGLQVDRGLLEIGQELMAVSTVDAGSGTVTLHPWGRGQRGTTPAEHAANSKVTVSPRFPRSAIASAVLKTVQSLYPDLYRVKSVSDLSLSPARISYEVPADADSIISVAAEVPGPSRQWYPLSRWSFHHEADPTDFPSGKSIDIYDALFPGRPLRITYRTGFGVMSSENASLASVGLQDRWSDLIVYGAAGNLVLGMEPLRLQSDAVETQERAEGVQPTQATTVARQLLGMFKQRIMEERSLLLRQHPPVLTRKYRSA